MDAKCRRCRTRLRVHLHSLAQRACRAVGQTRFATPRGGPCDVGSMGWNWHRFARAGGASLERRAHLISRCDHHYWLHRSLRSSPQIHARRRRVCRSRHRYIWHGRTRQLSASCNCAVHSSRRRGFRSARCNGLCVGRVADHHSVFRAGLLDVSCGADPRAHFCHRYLRVLDRRIFVARRNRF